MSRKVTLDQLRAKEAEVEERLKAHQQALKIAQAKRAALEHKLTRQKWEALGRLADSAGLGIIPISELETMLTWLAQTATNGTTSKPWSNVVKGPEV